MYSIFCFLLGYFLCLFHSYYFPKALEGKALGSEEDNQWKRLLSFSADKEGN